MKMEIYKLFEFHIRSRGEFPIVKVDNRKIHHNFITAVTLYVPAIWRVRVVLGQVWSALAASLHRCEALGRESRERGRTGLYWLPVWL